LDIILSYVIPGILVLSILVFVHELGHFLAAKAVGIRVERFSIGFPPRLVGKKIGDTDYCISAIPIGGYVKMSGMIDESMDEEGIKGEPWEFMSKPVWARALVISAGPIFNVLLTVAVFTFSVWITGIAEVKGPIVGDTIQDMPAASIGLQTGDRITQINERPIENWQDLQSTISQSAGEKITLTWKRDGETMSAQVIPVKDPINDVGQIGLFPQTETRSAGFFEGLGFGFKQTWFWTALIFKSLGKLISGEIETKENLAGPVRIVQMIGDSARGGASSIISITALLSLHLGLINLFPIPALDGGHLLLLGTEAVIRRPISQKVRMALQQVGMAMLLALMIFVIINDVMQIF
jgi:regulator of sigma E protease